MSDAIMVWRRTLAAKTLAVLLVSFAIAYVCLLVPRAQGAVTAIWLPNAVLLAVLAQSRRSQWSAFAVAGLIGQLLANLADGNPALMSAVLALCNCGEVVVCAALMRKLLGSRPIMSRPRTIGLYALIAAGASAGSAALATLFLSLPSGTDGLVTFVTWTVADFTALVTVTPSLILLSINRQALRRLAAPSSWPLAVLLLTAAATFAQDRYPHPYLIIAALLLTTWRMGIAGAALGVLATLVIAVGATVAGHGPFASFNASLAERVLALQLFLAVCFHLSVPVAIQNARAEQFHARLVEALAAARATRAKYRRIADSVRDMIVQTDREGRFLYVSPSCRQLGYSAAELTGRSSLSLIHPDDLPQFAAARDRFFASGGETPASPWRVRVRTREGEQRWLEGAPNLLRDLNGDPIAIETVFRDVTDSVAANAALVESETRYRVLAENLTDMAACYRADGVLQFVSPASKALLGYEPEELVGRQIANLLHPDDVARCSAAFAEQRAKGPGSTPFRIEYRLVRKDGSIVWVEAHPRPIFDEETGAFIEWQDVVRDVDERKALEAELRTARATAEAAAQAKADFLANMSHELRTPLTSVLGFAKLAEERVELQGPVRIYVERVRESSNALLALVNDILDFSKLEAGEVRFRTKPVDVSGLVLASLRLFEAQALEKGLTLETNDALPSGLRLQLDPDRLNQVLLNLIGNAVKFTHAGGVWVTPSFDASTRTPRSRCATADPASTRRDKGGCSSASARWTAPRAGAPGGLASAWRSARGLSKRWAARSASPARRAAAASSPSPSPPNPWSSRKKAPAPAARTGTNSGSSCCSQTTTMPFASWWC
ncbi:MAG TPA: PAS domain S-box protein [Phenylobacterium sp.]